MTDNRQLDEFLVAGYARLLRSAYLLTGDQNTAQDLAHDTVLRIALKWRRVCGADDPTAYARQILLNTYLGQRRRRWNGEIQHEWLPEPLSPSPYTAVDDRDRLRRALQLLPPRQRAAVVLRHFEQLSEAAAANELGCSQGNVKSLTSRGLEALRAHMYEGQPSRHGGHA